MGYEAEDQLDDLIRVATRLRGRVRESEDRTAALQAELSRLEGLISVKVKALREAGALDAEVR